MSPDTPVTAVCLTHPSRWGLAVRSLRSFFGQIGALNRRAIVLSRNVSSAAMIASHFTREIGRGWLDPILMPNYGPEHLLRHAIAKVKEAKAATPDSVMVLWDDDDVSHPLRLARQLESVQPKLPCYLSTAFWHYYDTGEIFVYDLEARGQNLQKRIIPSTMAVCVSDLRGEDATWNGSGSPTTNLGRAVQKRFNSTRLAGEFGLCKIGVRGDNAQGYEHHRGYISTPKATDVAWLAARRSLIHHWLGGYNFDPGPLDVCGRDGVAFNYEPDNVQAGMPPIGEPIGIERVTEITPEEPNP